MEKRGTLHNERRHVEIRPRWSRAFLREFNENRNWICSLRGITPVVPPPRVAVLLVPESSCRTGKVLSVPQSWFPLFSTDCDIASSTDGDNRIDFRRKLRGLYFSCFGYYDPPARGNWTYNLFRVSGFNVFPYIITEYALFPRAQHFASRCLMIVYLYQAIISNII